MAFFNILQKCDKALVAYIISTGAGTVNDVFPAKRSLTKTLPCTICESREAEPVGHNMSGTYEIDASVYVRTAGLGDDDVANLADTPAIESGDRVALTFDQFNIQQDQAGEVLAKAINDAAGAVSGFKMQDVQVHHIRAGYVASKVDSGDAWCDIIDLKIVASCNDDAGS